MTYLPEDPLALIAKFQKVPPVNIDMLAESMGLRVYKTNLGPSVSGMIQRDPTRGGAAGFAIYINSTDNFTRQRFSQAHEIAHFVLHRDLIEQGVTDDTLYRSSELSGHYETQANRLAADILMPIRLVKISYGANQSRSVSDLARLFQVSRSSMEIRLKGMNLEYAP